MAIEKEGNDAFSWSFWVVLAGKTIAVNGGEQGSRQGLP
jgi:hypothetical protein